MVRLRELPSACWMIFLAFFFAVILSSEVSLANGAGAEVSCECENSSCGPCEVETGVNFYSAKCGPANSRVKSCKKPSCVPVENQKQCFADLKLNQPQSVAGSESAGGEKPSSAPREPASAAVPAGEITDFIGNAKVIRASSGLLENPRVGMIVNVGDVIETQADGKVQFRLKDAAKKEGATEVTVPAKSKVKVERMQFDASAAKKQVLLNLMSGKVRSQVKEKYEDGNSFRVKTHTAVAGVRGTDFVVSFDKNKNDWVSEVRTLTGQVRLEGAGGGADGGMGGTLVAAVDIPGGTYASFVVKAPPVDDDEAAIRAMIEAGKVSPVFKMKDDEIERLDDETRISRASAETETVAKRGVSSESEADCQAPSGKYNQCSYSCEGNPMGSKVCRTDLQNVKCVRKLCRANGQWGEEHRLPASQGDFCDGAQPVVRDCVDYW